MGRTYLVILCGAADRPCDQLSGRTPYDAARMPFLDHLVCRGQQGLITIISSEIPPESDSGAMALLSYDPLLYYTGRGPLEGLGTGFVEPGQNAVSFRINFASFDPDKDQLDRRTARDLTNEELQALAGELREQVQLAPASDVKFNLMAFGRHRGILSFDSETLRLSGNVSNTDPGFAKQGPFGVPVADAARPHRCTPMDDSEAARNTAELVNRFVEMSGQVLRRSDVNERRRREGKLPANMILFRDGGDEPRAMPQFREKTGRSLSFYGQIPAEKGLMTLLGGRFTYARNEEGEDEERYLRDLAKVLSTDPADVLVVHLKGADEPGHDGEARQKVAALERIDEHFFGPLSRRLKAEDTVIVTSDHATPCDLRIHAADPVPAVVVAPSIQADTTLRLTEAEARNGGLPVTRAIEILPYALNHGVPAS